MAEVEHSCAHCERPFRAFRNKKYCSAECRYKADRLRRGAKSWREYVGERKQASVNWYVCRSCSTVFYRKMGGGQHEARFCGYRCYNVYLSNIKREAGVYRKMARNAPVVDMSMTLSVRLEVWREVTALRRLANRDKAIRVSSIGRCSWCASPYHRLPTAGSRSSFCSKACKASNKKHRRKIEARKCGKHWRQRARHHGVDYQRVDVYKVFERDGWHCQMCGKPTPESRRGTCHPNAPELDHRVPISKGGPHTYDNVQCSCRACNGAKGNKHSAGQLPLSQPAGEGRGKTSGVRAVNSPA